MRYLKIKNCGINPNTNIQEFELTEYKKVLGIMCMPHVYTHKFSKEQVFDAIKLYGKVEIEYIY